MRNIRSLLGSSSRLHADGINPRDNIVILTHVWFKFRLYVKKDRFVGVNRHVSLFQIMYSNYIN